VDQPSLQRGQPEPLLPGALCATRKSESAARNECGIVLLLLCFASSPGFLMKPALAQNVPTEYYPARPYVNLKCSMNAIELMTRGFWLAWHAGADANARKVRERQTRRRAPGSRAPFFRWMTGFSAPSSILIPSFADPGQQAPGRIVPPSSRLPPDLRRHLTPPLLLLPTIPGSSAAFRCDAARWLNHPPTLDASKRRESKSLVLLSSTVRLVSLRRSPGHIRPSRIVVLNPRSSRRPVPSVDLTDGGPRPITGSSTYLELSPR
jgi:hypothetical protein